MRQLTSPQLAELLAQADNRPVLLDVREPWEHQLCAIDGSLQIPMNLVPHSLDHLNPDQEIVVICHHGMRSMQVANFLLRSGFTKVVNLHGGINGWARQVDNTMATY